MLEKIKQIKYNRLEDDEKFFLNIIDGIQSFKSNKYPQSVFWRKNGIVLLEQDYHNGYLWVDYRFVWLAIEDEYQYSYDDIQSLILCVIEKNTNLDSLKPCYTEASPPNRWGNI